MQSIELKDIRSGDMLSIEFDLDLGFFRIDGIDVRRSLDIKYTGQFVYIPVEEDAASSARYHLSEQQLASIRELWTRTKLDADAMGKIEIESEGETLSLHELWEQSKPKHGSRGNLGIEDEMLSIKLKDIWFGNTQFVKFNLDKKQILINGFEVERHAQLENSGEYIYASKQDDPNQVKTIKMFYLSEEQIKLLEDLWEYNKKQPGKI